MAVAPILIIFANSFLVGFSGAISPGPLLAYNIKETVRIGFIAGPLVVAGHSLLELVTVAALAFGLAQVLDSDPVVAAIGLLGGGFLLWMSWGLLRNPSKNAPFLPGRGAPLSSVSLKPVIGGVLVSLSNPFWALWWLTVGAALITRSLEAGLVGLASFYLGHILSDLAWYGFVSGAVTSGKRFLSQNVYRGIILVCGSFLGLLGVYFVVTGIRLLGW